MIKKQVITIKGFKVSFTDKAALSSFGVWLGSLITVVAVNVGERFDMHLGIFALFAIALFMLASFVSYKRLQFVIQVVDSKRKIHEAREYLKVKKTISSLVDDFFDGLVVAKGKGPMGKKKRERFKKGTMEDRERNDRKAKKIHDVLTKRKQK